jgi:hypothetical protein
LEPLPMIGIGSEFTLIDNAGSGLPEGLFNGIPNGGLFAASHQLFRVFYDRGSGNDVVLLRDEGIRLVIRKTEIPGQCSVQGRGTNYATYAILTTTNLSDPVWEEVAAVPADGGGLFTYFDMRLTNEPARFFRSLGP